MGLLLEKLKKDDSRVSQEAMEGYLRLVEDFYGMTDQYVAPQQYAAAKTDVEYFLRLLDLAEYHCRDMERKEEGDNLGSS